MKIKLALLTNPSSFNLARKISLDLNEKYNTNINSLSLPQHISLKESFEFNGELLDLESYLYDFFSEVKSFYAYMDKIKINIIDEDKALAWIKVTESSDLRNIHNNLCQGLEDKFNIEPVGFDSDGYEFHSTITYSKINDDNLNSLLNNYNNKGISIGFNVKNIAMFCSINNDDNYFTYRIFEIGE